VSGVCRSALLLGALFVCSGSFAQVPDRPGPMQSGRHATGNPAGEPKTGGQPSPAVAASPGAGGGGDTNQLFATSCGWCHSKGGREAGKGPKLMDTALTDAEIIARIRNGKVGHMPAFGSTFDDAQLAAIVAYIRALKP
jgi:mono/diheme cytochrome c family protein